MMIRINSMRFQSIVNNYNEILNDLDEDYSLFISMNENDKFFKQVSNSFRNNIKEMYTIFEDYIAFSLSTVGVAVTENKLRRYIEDASRLKLIPEDFRDFYLNTLDVRNSFSHQYKKLNTKKLIKMYRDNRNLLYALKKFMESRVEQLIRNNRIDLLSLLDE